MRTTVEHFTCDGVGCDEVAMARPGGIPPRWTTGPDGDLCGLCSRKRVGTKDATTTGRPGRRGVSKRHRWNEVGAGAYERCADCEMLRRRIGLSGFEYKKNGLDKWISNPDKVLPCEPASKTTVRDTQRYLLEEP